ncbi:MAG: DUF2721 domain-containing protein [Chloroflexota bacterium]
MDTQMVGQIIQFIVAPVVMISSCSLVLNGLLARYGAINDRLRLMARERFELLRALQSDRYNEERLSEIDRQLPDLLHRHKQVHDAVLLTYCSIFLFLVTMFAIAGLVVSSVAWVSTLVLLLFLGALLALMTGVAIAVMEIYRSNLAVRYEAEQIAGLNPQNKGAMPPNL